MTPYPALPSVLSALTGLPAGALLHLIKEKALTGFGSKRFFVSEEHERGETWVTSEQLKKWRLERSPHARPTSFDERYVLRFTSSHRKFLYAAGEALEVLSTRGLWPWPAGDPAAPQWWCLACGGVGGTPIGSFGIIPEAYRCPYCAGAGSTPVPSAYPGLAPEWTERVVAPLPALITATSLGAGPLLRVQSLFRELNPKVELCWAVISEKGLRQHHTVIEADRHGPFAFDAGPWAYAFSREETNRYRGLKVWSETCTHEDSEVQRAWRVLRILARDLGLHVVGHRGHRVVVAVQPPYSPRHGAP